MNNNKPEEHELLRLFKCTIDTGTEVLSAFADLKLLQPYGGSFKRFLDDKKHQIFHMWQTKKMLCCTCPPAGCSFKRIGNMDNWIFKKLYDDSGTEISGHFVRNLGTVEQVCLHKYLTRNIAIHQLDISAISFLIRNYAPLTQNETTALDTIKFYRCEICHAYSMNCFSMVELNTAWTELEKALVELTQPCYRRIVQRHIQDIYVKKQEVTELVEKIQEVTDELKTSTTNNVKSMAELEGKVTDMSINNTKDITQHTSEQASYYAAQVEQKLTEKIQNTERNLSDELHATGTEIKDGLRKQETNVVEILRAVKNLELMVKYERPANLLVPEQMFEDAVECPVLWQFTTPGHFNLADIVATLRNSSNKDEPFKIKFVRLGSLVMLTTLAAHILNDPVAFEDAIIMFLTKMIRDCDIDTEIPGRVDVRLHILNANEVSLSCELPLEALNGKATGTKKQGSTQGQYDIAFLNADCYSEIIWVKRAAFLLEDTFGITCAIPGEDYLFGLPIDDLDFYYNQFKTVIVTLTRNSRIDQRYTIKSSVSSIVVELDYKRKIPPHLTNMPHINGSYCEHLWFSQLTEEIGKRHPDLDKRIATNKINEVPVIDCRRCTSLASTAVYHRLKFELDPPNVRIKVIFCGSLITESFIINLCNNLQNRKDPVNIRRWKKSIDIPDRIQKHDLAFVFVSKHLQKCESLEKCILSNIESGTMKWYSARIEEIENPHLIESVTKNMKVPSIDHVEIANEIASLLKKQRSVKLQHKAMDSTLSYDERSEIYRNILTTEILRTENLQKSYRNSLSLEEDYTTSEKSSGFLNPLTKGSKSTDQTTL